MTSNRPFASAPGRPVDHDQPPPIDIAEAYFSQRSAIRDDRELLEKLIAAVGRPSDLWPYQWAQWYATTLEFAPDLIIELGRGNGNSTALFAQAVHRAGRGRVVSFDLNEGWVAEPAVRAFLPPEWFKPLDLRAADIRTVDFGALIAGDERILVLWDAHGFDIAEVVLGAILPAIVDRPHLILIHDISDNRSSTDSRNYAGPIWRGSRWQESTGYWESRINIGWMNSIQDQIIAIADFEARNDVQIGSADAEYSRYFNSQPDKSETMTREIGESFFSTTAHWAFLSLTGKHGPFFFPPLIDPAHLAEASRSATLMYRLRRRLARLIAPS